MLTERVQERDANGDRHMYRQDIFDILCLLFLLVCCCYFLQILLSVHLPPIINMSTVSFVVVCSDFGIYKSSPCLAAEHLHCQLKSAWQICDNPTYCCCITVAFQERYYFIVSNSWWLLALMLLLFLSYALISLKLVFRSQVGSYIYK